MSGFRASARIRKWPPREIEGAGCAKAGKHLKPKLFTQPNVICNVVLDELVQQVSA